MVDGGTTGSSVEVPQPQSQDSVDQYVNATNPMASFQGGPGSQLLNSIAMNLGGSGMMVGGFFNGTFVAVGYGNKPNSNTNTSIVMTSTDGKTWTTQNIDVGSGLNFISYGNGIFVASSFNNTSENETNYVLTSPDGQTWSSLKLGTTENITNLAWGNGLFVAVCSGCIMTSPDGLTWTTQTLPVPAIINDVAYGDGLFVAAAASISEDKTHQIPIGYGGSTGPGFSPGIMYGYGQKDQGEVLTSSDGVNWNIQNEFGPNSIVLSKPLAPGSITVNLFSGVAFGNDSFVVVGGSGTILETSVAPATATTTTPSSSTSASAPATIVSPATNGQQNISFVVGQGSYTVDQNVYSMDGAPLISNGRTLVPVRYLADALGAQTAWNAASQQITITKGGTILALVIGSTAISTNGTVSQMDVAPVVENGRTYLPARYIAEAFNDTVSWDTATKTVSIAGQ